MNEKHFLHRAEELRKKIAVGVEQSDRGEVVPLDIELIIEAARNKSARKSDEAES